MTIERPSGSSPLASIVVPVFNARGRVEQLLDILASQECSFPWDLTFVDSGSSDGTREWLEAEARTFPVPLHTHELGPESFDHGDTRNFGAAVTSGELLIFLTDDSRPVGRSWLATVVRELEDGGADALFCRNVLPADTPAWAVTLSASDLVYVEGDPRVVGHESEAPTPTSRRVEALYCDTASALSRDLLERHPYPRASAGEDMLLARALREARFVVRKLDSAPVEHVHLYDSEQMRRRAALDGRFNMEAFGLEIVLPSQTGDSSEGGSLLFERNQHKLSEVLRDSEVLEEQRSILRERYASFAEGGSAGIATASGRRWPTTVLANSKVVVGLLHDDSQHDQAQSFRAALEQAGIVVHSLCTTELDEAHPKVDVVHALASKTSTPCRSVPLLRGTPCIVPEPGGWRLFPFGYLPAPHGAHARAELQVPVHLHPLDEPPRIAAARWAFRYRQLLCMSRSTVAYQRWGFEADQFRGEVRREGEVLATLGAGPAEVAFEIPPLGPDVNELGVELDILEQDRNETRCAVVAFEGREVALVGELAVESAPRTLTKKIELQVPPEGGRLTITNLTPAGSRSICRVRSVTLSRGEPCQSDSWLFVEPSSATPNPGRGEVAVVIVTLDGIPKLKQCLPALQASTYPGDLLQVVVVDNGYPRETRNWLARHHPNVTHVYAGDNVGFSPAANMGAHRVGEAPVIIFLNDDAEVAPGFVEQLVQPIFDGECAATAARMILPDGEPEYFGGAGTFQGFAFGGPEDLARAADLDRPRKTLFACGGAMAIDAAIFRGVGGFDMDYFAYYDDIDLGWRLWLYGYEVHYVPTAICHHARSSTSASFPRESVRLLQIRNAILTCIKNLGDEALRAVLPTLLALGVRRLWIQAKQPEFKALRIESLRPHRRSSRRALPLDRMAMADLVALQDVLGDWEKWMEKRQAVQLTRRRLDVEVLPLFLDPLRCVEGEAEYEALQASLLQLFDIKSLFGAD